MSAPTPLPDDLRPVARHDLVTGLQLLTLTAELLAWELRDGNRSLEEIERRSAGLDQALGRVSAAARSIPAHDIEGSRDTQRSFAESDVFANLGAYVGVVSRFAGSPEVERDVLAEYVDELHRLTQNLIAAIDEEPSP